VKHIIIGNGPSLSPGLLRSLDGITWSVNRIWKMFDKTDWRPNNWVRSEFPLYNEEDVKEDFRIMRNVDNCHLWIQKGFEGHSNLFAGSNWTTFETCNGSEHAWHLPRICAYGTVVHTAMQLAIINGATELELVGCDLGMPAHFYGQEGISDGDELALNAHRVAAWCSPVPIHVRTILTDIYGKD
jgi:hypothetical protein